MDGITYHNKDIASKVTGEALVGKNFGVFGLPQIEIIGILPTNLPTMESNELRLDNLFVLSDGSVAIIDYESVFDKENFVKYINYIARVIKRYANQKQLEQLKRIRMIVIYTADVESAECIYDLGGVVLVVESAYLVQQDTDQIMEKLEKKIQTGMMLTEEEQMQLMVLPLTMKGKEQKQKVIVKSVQLAKQISEKEITLRVLAGILTFSDKIIDSEYKKLVKEEMGMTQIEQMIFEEGMEKGIEQGIKAFISDNLEGGISIEQLIVKLQNSFSLTQEAAKTYIGRFSEGI